MRNRQAEATAPPILFLFRVHFTDDTKHDVLATDAEHARNQAKQMHDGPIEKIKRTRGEC